MTRTAFTLLVAIGIGAVTQQGKFPWKAGDPPPLVGGVPLAASRAWLDSVLGAPNDSQQIGQDGWAFTFKRRGLSIVYTPLDGAAIIYLIRREAGDIGGVRIGDTKEQVLARWGSPSTGQGPNALYIAGKWVVVVKLDPRNRHVIQLGLGRAAGSE